MKRLWTMLIRACLVLPLLLNAAPAIAQDESHKRAEQAIRAKDWPAAIRHAEATIDEFPDWFWGHYYLGKAHLGAGTHPAAIHSLNRSLDFATSADERFLGAFDLALAHYRSGDYGETLKAVTRAENASDSRFYRQGKGTLATMAGFSHFNRADWKAALAAFRPVLDAGTADADLLRAAARCHMETGADAEAIALMRKVVAADPADAAAHRILVQSLINGGNYRQAIAAADDALERLQPQGELHRLKGIALSALKEHASAAASFRAALDLAPSAELHRLMALALLKSGDWLAATRHFNAAQAEYRDDPDFLTQWGYCWYQYVPGNAELFKGSEREGDYLRALENAEHILATARLLRDADARTITLLMAGVENKRDRLEKGASRAVTVEYYVDPETGEIRSREIDPGAQ